MPDSADAADPATIPVVDGQPVPFAKPAVEAVQPSASDTQPLPSAPAAPSHPTVPAPPVVSTEVANEEEEEERKAGRKAGGSIPFLPSALNTPLRIHMAFYRALAASYRVRCGMGTLPALVMLAVVAAVIWFGCTVVATLACDCLAPRGNLGPVVAVLYMAVLILSVLLQSSCDLPATGSLDRGTAAPVVDVGAPARDHAAAGVSHGNVAGEDQPSAAAATDEAAPDRPDKERIGARGHCLFVCLVGESEYGVPWRFGAYTRTDQPNTWLFPLDCCVGVTGPDASANHVVGNISMNGDGQRRAVEADADAIAVSLTCVQGSSHHHQCSHTPFPPFPSLPRRQNGTRRRSVGWCTQLPRFPSASPGMFPTSSRCPHF